MQLNYRYINNQKPRFSGGVEDYLYGNPMLTGSLVFGGNAQAIQNAQNVDMGIVGKSLIPKLDPTNLPKLQLKGGLMKKGNTSGGFGAKSKAIDGAGMVQSAIAFGGDVLGAFNQPVKTSSELLTDAGTSQNQIGGVSYEQQNSINEDAAKSELNAQANAATQKTVGSGAAMGGSIGMAFGPIGGAVGAVAGGLLGGILGGAAKRRARARLRRRIFNGQQQAQRTNIFNRAGAQSNVLQQEYAQDYGDTQDDVLYANSGKDVLPMFNSGKNMKGSTKVWTPEGYQSGEHNSYVGKGESIINFNEGKGTLVTKGQIGVDNQPSSVREDDDNVILGNDVDWRTGSTFAEQARPYTAKLQYINQLEKKVGKYGDRSSLTKQTAEVFDRQAKAVKQQTINQLKEISGRQAEQHNIENNMQQRGYYKEGKESSINWNKLANGVFENITPALQLWNEYGRYRQAEKEPIYSSNTYKANPYSQRALQGLAGLRYDYRPELREYNDALRQSKYAMEQSGGLTAGQKYAARTSMYNDYLNNAAKLYSRAEQQNNAYKQQYYDALMKVGDADRSAMMTAMQYDDANYRRSQAAKRAYLDTIMKGMYAEKNRWEKRLVDDKRWKQTYSIYRDDAENKAADLAFRQKMYADKNKPKPVFIPIPTDIKSMMYSINNLKPLAESINFVNPYANRFSMFNLTNR